MQQNRCTWPSSRTTWCLWMVDLCSGYINRDEQRMIPTLLHVICAPDARYWPAIGIYHPREDLTIRSYDLGA